VFSPLCVLEKNVFYEKSDNTIACNMESKAVLCTLTSPHVKKKTPVHTYVPTHVQTQTFGKD
jgi:hypothetical protein